MISVQHTTKTVNRNTQNRWVKRICHTTDTNKRVITVRWKSGTQQVLGILNQLTICICMRWVEHLFAYTAEPSILLFLLHGLFALSPLSNTQAKPQAPSINNKLGQWECHSPKKSMRPVWCATRLIAYPFHTCFGIAICWWNKEWRFPDWCHLGCHI